MLEYIKLHNFQKYADYERSFNEKVNYITGVNGAGKYIFRQKLSPG